MAREAWRAYLEMALGMSEASRKKATKAVKRLAGKGGATAEQLQVLAEELVRTSGANREALARMVRVELDRALSRVGLATGEEVTELTARVRDLEQRLQRAEAKPAATPVVAVSTAVKPAATTEPVATTDAAGAPPVKKVVKKVVAKKVVAKAAPVPPAAPAGQAEPVAKKAVAKKTTPAKKTVGAGKAAVKAEAESASPEASPVPADPAGTTETPETSV